MAGGHAIAVSQGNLEIQDGFYTGGMSSAGTGGNGLAVLSGEESIKLTGGVFSGGAGRRREMRSPPPGRPQLC